MSAVMMTPHSAPTVPLPGLPPSDDAVDYLAGYCEQIPDDEFDVRFNEATDQNSIEPHASLSGVLLVRHLLPHAVLLKIAPGQKRPCSSGWQKMTHADMTPAYLEVAGHLAPPACGHFQGRAFRGRQRRQGRFVESVLPRRRGSAGQNERSDPRHLRRRDAALGCGSPFRRNEGF